MQARALAKALRRRLEHRQARGPTDERWDDLSARARVRAQIQAGYATPAMGGGTYFDRPTVEGALASSWPELQPALNHCGLKPWSPLRVALARIGDRTSFSLLDDPRIIVGDAWEMNPSSIDVLVLTRVDLKDFDTLRQDVPPGILERAGRDGLRLVFDSSGEAYPHKVGRSEAIHAFLREYGIPNANVAYMTQDRSYRADYESYCRSCGVEPMRIWIYDHFIHKTLAFYEDGGRAEFESRLAAYMNRGPTRERRFVSLNYTPRPAKILFLLQILKDRLWTSGWNSFGGFAADPGAGQLTQEGVANDLLAMEGFEDLAQSGLPYLDELASFGPILFGDADDAAKTRSTMLRAGAMEQYAQSWFSVVTESELGDRPLRITEKSLKPLLNFHPFLLLGNPGSLKMLRDLGFTTFGQVFDERYDDELSPRRRFDLVYDQAARLCRMDEAELRRLTEEISETVVFNACWGLTELPRLFRVRIGAEFAERVEALARPGSDLADRRPARAS